MPGDEAEAYGAHAGFWDHVGVLRNYLLAGAGIFVALAVAVFAFGADAIIHCLLKPLEGQTLLFLSPMGPFLFKIKIAVYAALLASFPVWLGLLLSFIAPALSAARVRALALFAACSTALGIGSLAFAYFYFIPVTLKVLQGFAVEGTTSMLTAESYLTFFLLELLVVFVVLQIPVVTVALSYIRLVNPYFLARQRRFAIIAIVALLAVVTPTTDVVTLLIVGVPAIALWEAGLLMSKAIYQRR